MKKIKKITMIVGTSIAMLSTTILAQAGIVNAPSGLVLRGEPERGGSVITTVEDKANVEIIEQNGEWYKVKYNGQEGFLFAEYVNVEEEVVPPVTQEPQPDENPIGNPEGNTNPTTPTSLIGTSAQMKNNANIYVMPLISSTPIGTFAVGATVTIEKEITNWVYVTDGTQAGWIRTYIINGEQIPEQNVQNPETPNTNQEQENPEPPAENNTTETPSVATKGKINVDFANVRKEASQDSEVVTTLAYETDFVINAETPEWYKITYTSTDGTVYEGYIAKRLVLVE